MVKKMAQKIYYVYLLRCADRSLYTGITTDVARRFLEHKMGLGGHYTCSHRVTKILYSERCGSRSAAQKREALIKSWSRAEKLRFIKTRST
ncbi:MAG: GIY-YIG nuclease family protein [Candidatus Niyogibacteria bacterium]|nr:GIY-YIG nuclease family protein [Candidatus Niyogibacteria bacterium]